MSELSQSPSTGGAAVLLALSTTVCRFFGHPDPDDFNAGRFGVKRLSVKFGGSKIFCPVRPFVFPVKMKRVTATPPWVVGICRNFLASRGLPNLPLPQSPTLHTQAENFDETKHKI